MSDRREAVARAFGDARESYIREALANAVCRGTDSDSYPNCVERIYELASLAGADAAIAAMDAEPTEAEVEAAAEQLWNRRHVSNIYRIDPSMTWEMANRPSAKIGWGTHVEDIRGDARAALIAARKARP